MLITKCILTAIFSFMLCSCSSLPAVVQPDSTQTATPDDAIYIVSHGWHTGVVLPATLIQSHMPALKQRFKDSPYLEFGWGDKGFYQTPEITSGLTLQAIFWPTEAVMHVVAVSSKAPEFFPNSQAIQICLNGAEYFALVKFVQNSFARDKEGKIIPQRNGLYGDSQFYSAVGDYYLMNTCNKWTAKALKSAGMDLWLTFKLTAASIMDYLVTSGHLAQQGQCPLTQQNNNIKKLQDIRYNLQLNSMYYP